MLWKNQQQDKIVALSRLILFFTLIVLLESCGRGGQEIPEDYSPMDPTFLSKGDTVMPFRYLHPESHDWKIEVRISGDDLHDLSHKMTSRKFTATERKLLERIRGLKFIYGVGRVHKATSTLRVYDHINLYEQHGLVFEKNYLALQSQRYGIMTCADQEEFFAILEDMY